MTDETTRDQKISGVIRKLHALHYAFDMKGANSTTMLRAINTLSVLENIAKQPTPSPRPHAMGRERQLEDALRNLMGCYDTPLSRRRFPPDDFMDEALTIARDLLKDEGQP